MFYKTIGIVIIMAMLLSACATHTPYISKPSSEASKQQWLAYYGDQFKAYGDSVLPPPDDAPEVARQAYTEAKAKWKKEKQSEETVLAIFLIVAAAAAGVGLGMATTNK
jgi:hypothetical protein